MRIFAKKGDANFRALTANLHEKYSRYSRLRFRAKQQFRTTAVFYQFT